MTTLLEIKGAEKRYSDQLLLDRTTVALPQGCKIGMVGRNGAGKSTLIRALVGEEELDAGEVLRHPRLQLGYLRQHDPFLPGECVLEFLMRDSEKAEWQCGEVAAEFALSGEKLTTAIDTLSGGWQTRVKLAALLLHQPNMLLLDEPTNFLDIRTQLLLEHFLKHFRGGCLIVSHDRSFLKATCTHTLELLRGKLSLFPTDIETYVQQKQERREHDQRVNAATLAKRKQLETFIQKNRANANTASQARSKKKQLEKLNLLEEETDEKRVRFHVPETDLRRGTALRCSGLAIGYENHPVADAIHLEIEHGQCTVVVGDNGQGKTTLLRTIVDSLPPLDGTCGWGHGCKIGIYAQHVYSTLPPEQTIFDYLDSCRGPETSTQTLLDIAGSFLFGGSAIEKKISVLSGGERARVCLAGLLLAPHNVLVLDEPGNHLDVETVESLAEALIAYQGTVILTSHDRHFVSRVADSVIEVKDGTATLYPANYEAYLHRIEVECNEVSGAESNSKREKGKRKEKKGRGRNVRKELAALERKINSRDNERKVVQQRLLETRDPLIAEKAHAELTELQAEISELESQWLELDQES
ncbi:MAG: ABC-F family ATP-binding cassette domain-containing protein [Pirellulales bacterium]|nr:ABC-F family ATP-binding cassette domain-containing protein [Pirellulales bacterium]